MKKKLPNILILLLLVSCVSAKNISSKIGNMGKTKEEIYLLENQLPKDFDNFNLLGKLSKAPILTFDEGLFMLSISSYNQIPVLIAFLDAESIISSYYQQDGKSANFKLSKYRKYRKSTFKYSKKIKLKKILLTDAKSIDNLDDLDSLLVILDSLRLKKGFNAFEVIKNKEIPLLVNLEKQLDDEYYYTKETVKIASKETLIKEKLKTIKDLKNYKFINIVNGKCEKKSKVKYVSILTERNYSGMLRALRDIGYYGEANERMFKQIEKHIERLEIDKKDLDEQKKEAKKNKKWNAYENLLTAYHKLLIKVGTFKSIAKSSYKKKKITYYDLHLELEKPLFSKERFEMTLDERFEKYKYHYYYQTNKSRLNIYGLLSAYQDEFGKSFFITNNEDESEMTKKQCKVYLREIKKTKTV